jgi:hypothetical protein
VAFNSSHATSDGGMAVRPAADPYITGPGIPLLPVASTLGDSSFDVTLRAAQAATTSASGKTAVAPVMH